MNDNKKTWEPILNEVVITTHPFSLGYVSAITDGIFPYTVTDSEGNDQPYKLTGLHPFSLESASELLGIATPTCCGQGCGGCDKVMGTPKPFGPEDDGEKVYDQDGNKAMLEWDNMAGKLLATMKDSKDTEFSLYLRFDGTTATSLKFTRVNPEKMSNELIQSELYRTLSTQIAKSEVAGEGGDSSNPYMNKGVTITRNQAKQCLASLDKVRMEKYYVSAMLRAQNLAIHVSQILDKKARAGRKEPSWEGHENGNGTEFGSDVERIINKAKHLDALIASTMSRRNH